MAVDSFSSLRFLELQNLRSMVVSQTVGLVRHQLRLTLRTKSALLHETLVCESGVLVYLLLDLVRNLLVLQLLLSAVVRVEHLVRRVGVGLLVLVELLHVGRHLMLLSLSLVFHQTDVVLSGHQIVGMRN